MDSALGTLVVALLGVTFGWEPVDDGSNGVEYVVQLEPELVDVLQSGQTVPIESYIPAEAGPIRKVRITVGKGDLPRTAVGAVSDGDSIEDTIVRGQNDSAPQRHTARRDGWSDDRYQYNQPPALPSNTLAPPAASWSQPAANPSRVATAVAQQPATAGWSSIGTGMSPPPLLTPSLGSSALTTSAPTNVLPTQNGFFLATPMSDFGAPAARAADPWGQVSTAAGSTPRSGTLSLPDPPSTSRSQAPDLWPATGNSQSLPASSGWDWPASTASAPTTGSIVDRGAPDSDLVPVSPTSSRRQGQPAASDWSWPNDGKPVAASQSPGSYRDDWPSATPANDASPNNAPLITSPRVPLRSDWPAQTSVAASEGWGDPRQSQPLNLPAPPVSQQTGPHLPEITTAPGPVAGVPGAAPHLSANQTLAAPQQPWLPLLLVSLSLAGSIGANFYLGWSYMDARQRYRSLVDKTAEVFRRVTGTAA